MKKLCSLILAIIIVALSFPITFAADNDVKDFANLVVFVKLNGETKETVNETDGKNSNYSLIKSYYNCYMSPYNENIDASLKNYVYEVSRGKVNVMNYFPQDENTAFAVLSLNESDFADTYSDGVINEVITAFNNGTYDVPSGKLDNDSNGVLDNLTVIVEAGYDDYEQYDVTTSHKGIYGGSDKIGGLYVSRYNMLNTYMIFDNSLMRQGVMTHEFMHTLGFADLYRYSGTGSPVGRWDLMASAASTFMPYPLSYMRYSVGWIPMSETNVSGHYSLDAVTDKTGNILLKLKTPMSDSEFFCLEYRQKNSSTTASFGFETKIPSSGLLIYRVNTALDELNNKDPEKDFIYLFRPGDTDAHASAGDEDYAIGAAVNPDIGETAYGSADFSAEVPDNTIFYSDGRNSGIVISNIAYNADKSKIEFDVTFPDFSSLGLWKKSGENLFNNSSMSIDIVTNENTAFVSSSSLNFDAFKYSAKAVTADKNGQKVLSSKSNSADIKTSVVDNVTYVASLNTDYNTLTVEKVNGNTFSTVGTYSVDGAYFSNLSLFNDGNNLYASVVNNNETPLILSIDDSGITVLDDTLPTESGGMLANPEFHCFDGKIYALYSISGWNLTNKNAMLKCYDTISGIWTDVATLSASGANTHRLSSNGTKLYGIAGGAYGKNPVFFTYDGTTVTESDFTFEGATTGLSVAAYTDFVAVSFIKSGVAYVYCDTGDGSGFKKLGGDISTDAEDIKIAAADNRIWAVVSESSSVYIKSKAVRKPVITPSVGSAAVNTESLFIVLPKATKAIDTLIAVSNGGSISSPDTGNYFGTGRRIVLSDADGDANAVYKAVVMGDLDGDGAVDALDAFISEKAASKTETLTDVTLVAADFNGDGDITAADYAENVNAVLSE